jgi:hypothetical protein
LGAVCDEDLYIAEIIQMMENGRNAKRPHGHEEHGTMERDDVGPEKRKQSEIIQPLQKPYGEFLDQPRDMIDDSYGSVKIILLCCKCLRNSIFEAPTDIGHRKTTTIVPCVFPRCQQVLSMIGHSEKFALFSFYDKLYGITFARKFK